MKRNNTVMWITLLSCVVLAGVVSYTKAQLSPPASPDSPLAEQTQTPDLPTAALLVSVVTVEPGQYRAEVEGYGEAKSRYELSLTAELSGRVIQLGDSFDVGKRVVEGELLAQLEQTRYVNALSNANSELAQARLDLLEEQRQGDQARLEWQRSGLIGEPDSPLVLREPQLAQVTAAFESAEQALIEAQHDLNNTMIRAPFDALVISRDIQLGSYLQQGAEIATLYSTDLVDVSIPLSQAQWLNLPSLDNAQLAANPQAWPVTLINNSSQQQWSGYVTRIQQHLDTATRQRALIVTVEDPLEQDHPLYPGTFVTASIQGIAFEGIWKLPQSVISQQGDIWYVDSQGKLAKHVANKHFEQGGYVYLRPFTDSEVQIVKRPLSSYRVGALVQVQEEASL